MSKDQTEQDAAFLDRARRSPLKVDLGLSPFDQPPQDFYRFVLGIVDDVRTGCEDCPEIEETLS